ncbi:hypothetical protein [Idiomarina ramblicola]|uniref:Uncharacterized protein n=1 Tax=Idiomarina ramblicola TaxID=263724 RepID=A0A432Z1S9_9GAMM|nr:hypothetical protein [Idiomarina ramblicola]RUO71793.1 hypothetical protein CWI78_04555 [Idiomarina ramblicola]
MTEAHTTIRSVHALKEQQSVATADSINQALTNTDGFVFVFYSHPSIYVANKLQQGENGKQACNDWLKGINEVLMAQRKNRRRVRLLCVQDALEHGSELNQQTSLTAEQLSDYQAEVSDLELMAGHQLVLQNDDIMQLIERLEASTLRLSEQAYRVAVNVEAVLNANNETTARISSGNNDLNSVKEENELLLLQLQQVQEELEKTYIDKKSNDAANKYQQRIEELESENQLLMQQVTNQQEPAQSDIKPEQVKELEEENELLLLQLQQVQEELEAYFIKYQDAQKELSKVKSEFNQMRDQKKKVKEENNKILKQLLTTQEQAAQLTEQLGYAQSYQKKFKTEQQKANELRNGLAAAQRELQELRIKYTPKKPLSKGAKVKQKLLRRKLNNNALPKWLNEQIQQVEHSPLFDRNWYLSQYPDLASINIDPAEHFVRYGGFESRSPSPDFDTEFYVKKYPDVLAEGMNPLLHYILHGEAEGRLPKAGK